MTTSTKVSYVLQFKHKRRWRDAVTFDEKCKALFAAFVYGGWILGFRGTIKAFQKLNG